MASKKYTLLFALGLVAASGGFAQLNGTVNYADSSYNSYIPAKRMAQQNEWRQNSKNQNFPARPRDMWQIGLTGGLLTVNGDCPPIPGWNVGLQIRKALGYVLSVRGSVTFGQTKGLDYRQNPNIDNHPTIAALYRAAPGFYVHNFKSTIINPSLEALISLNNIMFHQRSSKLNVYALLGYSPVIYRTKLDILNANGAKYNYSTLTNAFFARSRKDVRSDLKNFFDGTYETDAELNDRRPNFGNSGRGKYNLRHAGSIGAGLEYRLTSRLSLGAEIKYVLTTDDYIDGWFLNQNVALSPEKDNLYYTNLSVNYDIGNASKRVAPLWKLNPLNYVYSELNNPTHMKFPKPVLDDTDNDGVTDQFDIEPNTPAGCPVDTKGKSRDTDGDGVPDCRDKELITPTACQPVNADGVGTCPEPPCCKEIKDMINNGGLKGGPCNIGALPSVQFGSGKVSVGSDAAAVLASAAAQIKANPGCKICVVGHGGASKREQQLSWDRVNAVINYLVEKQGISADRFVFKYGEEGDANTVDLQNCTGEDGPNMVPPPAPQYQKKG